MFSGVTPFDSSDVKESGSGGESPKTFSSASPPSSAVINPVVRVAKPRGLTLKRQAYVQAITNPKSKAFLNKRQAYKAASPHVSDHVAGVEGHRLLTIPSVQAEVRKELKRLGSKEDLEGEVRWNMDTAREKGKLPDHLNAAQLALKLGGHLVDKQEIKHISDEERESIRRLVLESLPN